MLKLDFLYSSNKWGVHSLHTNYMWIVVLRNVRFFFITIVFELLLIVFICKESGSSSCTACLQRCVKDSQFTFLLLANSKYFTTESNATIYTLASNDILLRVAAPYLPLCIWYSTFHCHCLLGFDKR